MDVEVEDWVDGGGHFHHKPIIIIITVLIAVIITGLYTIFIIVMSDTDKEAEGSCLRY